MSAQNYARAFFLEQIYSSDFDEEFPQEWIEIDDAITQLQNAYRGCFYNMGFRVPETSAELEADVAFILNSPAFEKDGDDYTGVWVRVNLVEKDSFIRKWTLQSDEAGRLTSLGGAARMKAAIRSAQELGWANDDNEKLEIDGELKASNFDIDKVPASDRIVTRTDNQPQVELIESTLNEVQQLLRADNEVGAELSDGRSLISDEIAVAQEVLKQGRFRASSLIGWLSPALKFLAEKFAGGAIGEAAKRLMQLLMDLLL